MRFARRHGAHLRLHTRRLTAPVRFARRHGAHLRLHTRRLTAQVRFTRAMERTSASTPAV